MNLLPRDEKFFDLFHRHARILCQSSNLLISSLKSGYQAVCDVSKQMEALERSGDEVIHEIFRRLQSTFITPFDPEDIQTLATALDNVLDAIEDATFRIAAYRLDPIPPGAVELGRMIAECCQAMALAFDNGGRLLVMGNGGSLCDAAHVSVEFMHPIIEKRPPLPAI